MDGDDETNDAVDIATEMLKKLEAEGVEPVIGFAALGNAFVRMCRGMGYDKKDFLDLCKGMAELYEEA